MPLQFTGMAQTYDAILQINMQGSMGYAQGERLLYLYLNFHRTIIISQVSESIFLRLQVLSY